MFEQRRRFNGSPTKILDHRLVVYLNADEFAALESMRLALRASSKANAARHALAMVHSALDRAGKLPPADES
jgi:hypothetical protein